MFKSICLQIQIFKKKIAVSLKRQIVLQKLYDKNILCWVRTYEGAVQKNSIAPTHTPKITSSCWAQLTNKLEKTLNDLLVINSEKTILSRLMRDSGYK